MEFEWVGQGPDQGYLLWCEEEGREGRREGRGGGGREGEEEGGKEGWREKEKGERREKRGGGKR